MNRRWVQIVAVCGVFHAMAVLALGVDLQAGHLRCEYLNNPQGIDTEKPRLSWQIASDQRGQRQTAYRVLVADSEAELVQDHGNLWDSGKVASDRSIQVAYDGKPLVSRTQCYWKVQVWDKDGKPSSWSKPAAWSMGLLKPSDWSAQWIGITQPGGKGEFPRLRKTFVLDKQPSAARVYVSSLGYHELYINGKKVGDDVLSPAVSQLSDRSYYLTYEVTPYLREGTNCVALSLGRGWCLTGVQGYAKLQHPEGPIARMQLEITGAGDKDLRIVTDGSWKATPGPITRTSGSPWAVRFDASQDQPGWNTASFNDRGWTPASVCNVGPIAVCAQMVEPNRIVRTIEPVRIESKGKDSWLIDMGTNLAGWFRLRLPKAQPAGQKIVIDYGDHLGPNGQPVGHGDRDEYITSGKENELIENRLSYQAFRYVTLSGLPTEPKKEDATACLIRTNYESGSTFACSNTRVTAIHDMILYTFQCLTLGGYMVDCPHYERLGYGGDGHASVESALMMYSLGPFYRSWLAAWRDCQGPDGDLPHTAPSYFAGGGPFWPAFAIATPWYVYRQYDDRKILEDNYPVMQKWLGFVEQHSKKGNLLDTWPNSLRRNWYLGDWATPTGIDQTEAGAVKLVNNCVRVYCYDLMRKIATAIGKKDDAVQYQAKVDSLREVVHKAFYNPETKTYLTGGQIELAFPLLTDIAPQELRASLLGQLERDIVEKRKGHLAVGLVGVPILVKSLMKADRNDLILTFVDKDDYPGWGHMLKQGATTTWEHWNGERSHIHNCYNSIGMWFYQGVAGIRPDPASPGFKHFTIRPAIVADLTWAKATCQTVHGPVASEWKRDGNHFELTVHVPANTTATVHVPAKDAASVTESGKQATASSGVRYVRKDGNYAVFETESGHYTFRSTTANDY